MSSVFDRLRSGAGKAAFEADKLRRVTSVQSIVKSLKEEITQAFYRAGYVAFDTYRAGRITQPELLEACERIAALQAQIAAREREIEAIRNEAYAEPTHGPRYGHVCPNGHGDLPPGAQFCPVCGAQATYVPPPAAGAACRACGTALAPGARFCPKCGAPVQVPSTPPPVEQRHQAPEESPFAPPPPASILCPNCGTALAPGARFCPDCGTPAPGPSPALPAEPEPEALGESPPPPPEPLEPVPSPPPARGPTLCPECGASLVPGAAFCPDCGHRLIQSTDAASEMATPEESQPPMAPEPPDVDADQAGDEWKL
jgi:uncharacterized OB-fold protein